MAVHDPAGAGSRLPHLRRLGPPQRVCSTVAGSACSPIATPPPARDAAHRSARCARPRGRSAHVESDGVGVGSDHDLAAAEQFHDAGVDVVLPFVSGSSLARMLARSPTRSSYRAVRRGSRDRRARHRRLGQRDAAAIYEGTPALVMSRVGEVAAGRPLDAGRRAAPSSPSSAATGRGDRPLRARHAAASCRTSCSSPTSSAVLCTALRNADAGHRTASRWSPRSSRSTPMPSASGGRAHVPARRALGLPGDASDRVARRAVARRVRLPADRHLDDRDRIGGLSILEIRMACHRHEVGRSAVVDTRVLPDGLTRRPDRARRAGAPAGARRGERRLLRLARGDAGRASSPIRITTTTPS